jgi:hypothetical protein
MARIMDTLSLYRARRLSCVEAVELLGTCERHFGRSRPYLACPMESSIRANIRLW